jgi:hypothetical protein
MSCKLYLVPEDIIQTWRSEQRSQQVDNPVDTSLGQIDKNMQNILRNNTMSDSDKEKLFTQKLGTYVHMRDQTGQPAIPIPVKTELMTTVKTEPETLVKSELPHDILASVPKMYRRKADAFVKYLQSDQDVSWDNKGRLLIKGKLIPDSHIVDLMHDALRLRKKVKRAKGWRELSRHLKKQNAPRELLGNEQWSTPPNSPVKSQPAVRFSVTPGKPRKSKILGRQKIRQWIKLQNEEL